jgi:hypothetical protein
MTPNEWATLALGFVLWGAFVLGMIRLLGHFFGVDDDRALK